MGHRSTNRTGSDTPRKKKHEQQLQAAKKEVKKSGKEPTMSEMNLNLERLQRQMQKATGEERNLIAKQVKALKRNIENRLLAEIDEPDDADIQQQLQAQTVSPFSGNDAPHAHAQEPVQVPGLRIEMAAPQVESAADRLRRAEEERMNKNVRMVSLPAEVRKVAQQHGVDGCDLKMVPTMLSLPRSKNSDGYSEIPRFRVASYLFAAQETYEVGTVLRPYYNSALTIKKVFERAELLVLHYTTQGKVALYAFEFDPTYAQPRGPHERIVWSEERMRRCDFDLDDVEPTTTTQQWHVQGVYSLHSSNNSVVQECKPTERGTINVVHGKYTQTIVRTDTRPPVNKLLSVPHRCVISDEFEAHTIKLKPGSNTFGIALKVQQLRRVIGVRILSGNAITVWGEGGKLNTKAVADVSSEILKVDKERVYVPGNQATRIAKVGGEALVSPRDELKKKDNVLVVRSANGQPWADPTIAVKVCNALGLKLLNAYVDRVIAQAQGDEQAEALHNTIDKSGKFRVFRANAPDSWEPVPASQVAEDDTGEVVRAAAEPDE